MCSASVISGVSPLPAKKKGWYEFFLSDVFPTLTANEIKAVSRKKNMTSGGGILKKKTSGQSELMETGRNMCCESAMAYFLSALFLIYC